MKVLAIVSQKGGAGKTTLATHLAVTAEEHGLTTVIFDLDPQASAAIWSDQRGDGIPAVVPAQAPRLASFIEQAQQKGADLVILDTPPEATAITAEAVRHAVACLIPCRPAGFDLAAIPASIQIVKNANKPFFVVCNAAPVQGVEVDEMRAALGRAGVEMAPVVLHQRKPYSARSHEGRTASEVEPKGKAAAEIRELFLWVCEKVIMLPSEQVTKLAKQQAA